MPVFRIIALKLFYKTLKPSLLNELLLDTAHNLIINAIIKYSISACSSFISLHWTVHCQADCKIINELSGVNEVTSGALQKIVIPL